MAYFDACAEAADAWSTSNGTVTVDKQDVANWVTGVLVGAVKRHKGVTHKGGSSGGEPLRGLPESAGAARVGELLARVAASTSKGTESSTGTSPVGAGITARMAKSVLAAMVSGDSRPIPEIATELFGGDGEDGAGGDGGDGGAGVGAGEDGEALEATCAAVVASMPEQLAAYRGGRTRAMGSFVGEVMKRTKGRADPRRAAEIIKSLVDQ